MSIVDDGIDKEWHILESIEGARSVGTITGTRRGSRDHSMITNVCLDKTWDFIDHIPERRNYIPVVGGVFDVVDATRRLIASARDSKSPPPPMVVVGMGGHEGDVVSLPGDYLDQVLLLGVDGRDAFPMAKALRAKFDVGGDDDPKFVRVDTARSYRDFRAASSPEMAELQRRVSELEAALRFHLVDTDAHAQVQGYLDDISRLQVDADPSAKRVPLSMPPWAEGKFDCWREGDLICCSIAVPGADGCERICTSATPVRKHVEAVVGYAQSVGADVVDMLGMLPAVACIMGGGSLIPQMAAAAPQLLARPEVVAGGTFVGRLVPASHPSFAAVISLLQHAQSGDEDAADEWQQLAEVSAHEPLLAEQMDRAKRRMLEAQGGLT